MPLTSEDQQRLQGLMAQDRRLRILVMLASVPGHTAPEDVVWRALNAMGHVSSHDLVQTDLLLLQELQLVNLAEGDWQIVKLTTRGEDVAGGRARAAGVAVPTD